MGRILRRFGSVLFHERLVQGLRFLLGHQPQEAVDEAAEKAADMVEEGAEKVEEGAEQVKESAE